MYRCVLFHFKIAVTPSILQQFTFESTNIKIDRLPMIELYPDIKFAQISIRHMKSLCSGRRKKKNHSKIMLSKLFQDNILMEANINENIFVCLVDCVILKCLK